jgi:hypothetical protein
MDKLGIDAVGLPKLVKKTKDEKSGVNLAINCLPLDCPGFFVLKGELITGNEPEEVPVI